MKTKIVGLFVGKAKPLGEKGRLSAMKKVPVKEELKVFKTHLPGDEVADLKHHGGKDRIIHHYTVKNYEHLKKKFPENLDLFIPGSYGENLTTSDWTEEDLCIGDIFRVGSSLIQLTEPRKPCATIDLGYGVNGVLKEIVASRKYGWMYRILEEGTIRVGDEIKLSSRPYPEFIVDKLIYELFQARQKNVQFLKSVRDCPALSKRFIDRLNRQVLK